MLFKTRNHNTGQWLRCGRNAPDFAHSSSWRRTQVAADAVVAFVARHEDRLLALVRLLRLELNFFVLRQAAEAAHLDDRLQEDASAFKSPHNMTRAHETLCQA